MGRPIDIRRIEVIDDASVAMFRAMSPGQRVRIGLGSWEFAARVVEGGVRCLHPEWNDQRVKDEVARRRRMRLSTAMLRMAESPVHPDRKPRHTECGGTRVR